ncbi:hypothetical protein Psta_2755 [Pirellula staleyi DSM 6068]|uniref:Uncharacterized protein n=1 Tax=Pirellula staleyi (strain ATCC 27377 / DSM 6068 / ICPB 4128) TaxID=530564 RepID=D2R7J5_PIRSD|nr:hypothetical protein Psta_2755 [Pirellula staleyi DSM 6068]
MGSRSRDMAGSRMEPERFDFRPQLDDELWTWIADLSPPSWRSWNSSAGRWLIVQSGVG